MSHSRWIAALHSIVWCLLALVLAAPTASADGMPRGFAPYAPVPSFAGFYLGGHVGYIHGGPRSTLIDDANTVAPEIFSTSLIEQGNYGLQGGYNFQSGSYLLGVEVDWSWAGRSRTVLSNDGDNAKGRLTDFGSVRGRAGFVHDRVLFFGTLGWGWARANYSALDFLEAGQFSTHMTDSGVVWGGGLEYLASSHVTLRAEYLHYDFNKDRTFAYGGGEAALRARMQDIDEARLSLNFKFGDDRRAAPLK